MNGVLFMFMGWKVQQCKDVNLPNWLYQLSIYCSLAPNLPCLAWSVITELESVSIFPLSADMILTLSVEGSRGIVVKKEVLFWFWWTPLGRLLQYVSSASWGSCSSRLLKCQAHSVHITYTGPASLTRRAYVVPGFSSAQLSTSHEWLPWHLLHVCNRVLLVWHHPLNGFFWKSLRWLCRDIKMRYHPHTGQNGHH